MAEKESGAISGAAQGAAVGTMIMPGIGTAIGAVVGAIGGLLSGGAAQRSRIYANRASKTQKTLSLMEAGLQRRDMLRQARMARAESLAAITSGGEGGMLSSAPRGALSSMTSQTGQNIRYFDARIRDYVQQQFWLNKAGKKSAQAQNIAGMMSGVMSAAQGYAMFKAATTPPTTLPPPTTSTPPPTSAGTVGGTSSYMGSIYGGGG